MLKIFKNKPNMVILHCAATPDSEEPKHNFGVKDIDMWHKARGWSECGYHIVIKRDGTIEQGRPLDKKGAHAKGHNKNTIGVCYIGTRVPTEEQKESLRKLFSKYRAELGISMFDWRCHNEFSDKECPGFSKEYLYTKILGA